MKLARRILIFLTLGSVFAMVGFLIAAIFGFDIWNGVWWHVFLSLATVIGAGAFALNTLNFMKKNKIIAFISFGLLGTLTVLLFIVYWGGIDFNTSWFAQFVTVVAITTIFFNIIISNYLKLGRNHFAIQMVTYVLIGAIDVVLMLEIFQVEVMQYILRVFIIACLLVFGLLITLAVLGKKIPDTESAGANAQPQKEETIDGEKVVKIKQSEYTALLQKIVELQKQLDAKNNDNKGE